MKVRRYKKVHRCMNFYINNYGFREPYQMLVDGTFCFAALNNQVNIAEVLPKYLQGELKLLTTQCVLLEMEKLGSKVFGALLVLKQYSIHKCGHERKAIPGAECLLSMVNDNNNRHYIIATQDRGLQSSVRKLPAVPLVFLHQKAPVLEKPDIALCKESNKVGLTELESARIEELKQQNGMVEEVKPFRKTKKKGPNPLSCKKKKKKGSDAIASEKSKEKAENKRGKKVRIPKHLKDVLFQNGNT